MSVEKTQTRAEVAEHIALESSRLVRLANEQRFPFLAHLIDMVVLEAWREASEAAGTSRGPEDV